MKSHHISRIARDRAIEKSLDAALEIDEVLRKRATEAQSLTELSELLLGTADNHVLSKRELLNSPQFASLYYRAARAGGIDNKADDHLERLLQLFAKVASIGLNKFNDSDLKFIRDFCLGLNAQLVNEAYGRIPLPSAARNRQLMSEHGYGC